MDALAGFVACLLALGYWYVNRREATKAKQAACYHRWKVVSLYGEGRYYFRTCSDCKLQETCDKDGKPRR